MQKSIVVNRGLFLVRYESAHDVFFPPQARVFVEPGSERHLSVILHPDRNGPLLPGPGTCLVVRAVETGKLCVELTAGQANGSLAAIIKLVPLSEVNSAPNPQPQFEAAPVAELDLTAMRILGHVAGIGDVIVGPNEWIGGPAKPSRIEGFAIEWPGLPGHINLRYSAKIGGRGATAADAVSVGMFAGTRGRALPLTGATLELAGAVAASYQFAVEAVFLGSPKMRLTGERVVLSGPTGREPLVGLRIGLEPINAAARGAAAQSQPAIPPTPQPAMSQAAMSQAAMPQAAKPQAPASQPAAPLASGPSGLPVKPTGRVRVFRSAAKRSVG